MSSSTPTQPTLPISSLIHPTVTVNNPNMYPATCAEALVKTALDDLEEIGRAHV